MLLEHKDPQLDELQKCSLPSWYEIFETITVPSKFIQIPANVLNYLRDEIVVLPKECYPNDCLEIPDNYCDDEENSDDAIPLPEFPQFSNQIKDIITSLNGAAFIKTNWHSPKDAFWITAGQTLKVTDITDLYQLLKASNIAKKDLNNYDLVSLNNDNCQLMQHLILKEWREIHPGTEFRCFVKNLQLLAISPRDWPQYHKYIIGQKSDIINDIETIFKEKIRHRFSLQTYCFDVIRDAKDNVTLVDFSPFNSAFTDALAFDWDYLKNDENFVNNKHAEFRYLATDCCIQPSQRNNYGYPQDIIEAFSNNSNNNISDLLSRRFQDVL